MSHYYHLCRSHIGRMVEIRSKSGQVYRGKISRVTPSHVYLTPVGRRISGTIDTNSAALGQHAVSDGEKAEGNEVLWGFGWWIAFAAIAALAFLPFFFWW